MQHEHHPRPATEQRVQREAELRNFESPAQLINLALDYYIQNEAWSDEEKAWLDQRLDESMAGIERGEGIPSDQIRAVLAARTEERHAQGQRGELYMAEEAHRILDEPASDRGSR